MNQARQISTKVCLGPAAKDVLALAALILLALYCYTPNPIFYFRDDIPVLSERLYFASDIAWLKHLLFFNKTRLTHVGDFMLFRPGLFFCNWLLDVTLRHSRQIQEYCALVCAVFAVYGLYFLLKDYFERYVAFFLACLPLLPPDGGILLVWPHISPYCLAIGFYVWGLWVLGRGKPAAWLFLLASLFHEFAAIALVLFIVLLWLVRGWGKDLRGLLTALALYSLAALGEWFYFKPESFYSPGESLSILLKPGVWSYLAREFGLFGHQLGRQLIFLNDSIISLESNYIWLLPLFCLAVPKLRRIFLPRSDIYGLGGLAAILALFFGVVLGRLITRGEILPWYHLMLAYFILLYCATGCGRVFCRERFSPLLMRGAVFCLLIPAVCLQCILIRVGNANSVELLARQVGVSQRIVEYLQAHPEQGYAGIIAAPELLDANTCGEINLLLYYKSFAFKSNLPVYFQIIRNEQGLALIPEVHETNLKPGLQSLPVLGIANAQQLDLTRQRRDINKFEPANRQNVDQVQAAWKSEEALDFQEIRFEVRAGENSQVNLYNLGIFLFDPRSGQYRVLALEDDQAVIYLKNPEDKPEHIGRTPLFSAPRDFSLILRSQGEDCQIFMDQSLLMLAPGFAAGPVRVGLFNWENGLPRTQVQEIVYLARP